MKKIIGILLIFLAVILAGAGCARKEGEKGKVVLRFMHNEDVTGIMQFEELFSVFRKKFPDVKLSVSVDPSDGYETKILTEAAANDLPDVFYAHDYSFSYFSEKGIIQPLDKFFEGDTELKLNDFHPNMVRAMSYKGKVWCLPKGCNTMGLYYNKNMFDKAGLKYPNENWTWTDMIEAAKKLTLDTNKDGITDQYGVMIPTWHPAFMTLPWSNGGDLVTPDGRKMAIEQPGFLEAARMVSDLINKYKSCPSFEVMQQQGEYQLFMTNRVAMFLNGSHLNSEFCKITAFDWDVAPIPKSPKTGKRSGSLPFMCWVMSAKTAHPKEAWEFMKIMAGPVGARRFSRDRRDMPVIKDAEALRLYLDPNKKPKNMKVFIDALDYARTLPLNGIYFIKLQNDFYHQMMDGIKLNLGSMEKVLKESSDKMQKKLDDFWKELDSIKK